MQPGGGRGPLRSPRAARLLDSTSESVSSSCHYSTGEIIAIVFGFILAIIPGIILLFVLY